MLSMIMITSEVLLLFLLVDVVDDYDAEKSAAVVVVVG